MQIQATYKDIWRIAFPVILGSLAQSINQMIDTAFLGRVGIIELGAGNLAGLFFLLLILVGLGFTKGAQIIIARKAGENDYPGIGRVFDQLVYKAAFLSVVLFFISYFIVPNLTPWLISSPGIGEKSIDFLKARSWGVFPGMLGLTMTAFFTGIGRTRIISVSTVIQAAVNILFDWLMIFGNWGFPVMGIKGAAYATVIAEVVGAIVYIIALARSGYIRQFDLLQLAGLHWKTMKEMIFLSLPLVFQNLIGLGSWQVFFLMIEKMGDRELAISTIVKSLYIFIGIPAWGLASTANTVVSNLVGQNRQEDIPKAIKKTIHIAIIFSSFFIGLIFLSPEFTLSIYTNDAQLIADSIPTLMVLLPALVLFSVSIILLHSIMGLGATKASLYIEFACISLYLFHVAIATVWLKTDLPYVWMSEWTYWLVMLLLSLLYFRVKRLTFRPL
jgi:putative MATE family efflux protein